MCTTSSPVLFCKKFRGTKRPWYWVFERHPSAAALSIQQKFWFEISKIPRAQWNGSFRSHRPVPSHRVFAYCSCCKQDTKERYRGQQFFQMERGFLVGPTEMSGLVKVNDLQRRSQIFRSGRKRNGSFHLISNQNLRIFGVNGKCLRKIGCNKFMMHEM